MENNKVKRIKIRQSQRLQIASSQGYKCLECNKTLGCIFHIDHQVALCLNGEDRLSNLCALCPDCHAVKTNNDMQQYWDRKKEERTGKSKYFDPYSVFYIGSSEPPIKTQTIEVALRSLSPIIDFNQFSARTR